MSSPVRVLTATTLALTVLAGCQMAPLLPQSPAQAGRVLISAEGGTKELAREISALGGQVTRSIDSLGMLEVQAPDEKTLRAIQALPGVGALSASRRRSHLERMIASAAVGDPNLNADLPPKVGPGHEPMSGYQWGLEAAHVPEAWGSGYRGQGALVAVLDTGIDPDNRDLQANTDFRHARSFVSNEPDIIDRNGHGSHVAGIIAGARNGYGIVGVAPRATILPIKVLDANGYGDDAGILQGIDYAVSQGASIINMSFGGLWDHTPEGERMRGTYASALRHAESRGVLVVTSAGNDGLDVPSSGQFLLPGQAAETALIVGAFGPFAGENPFTFAPYSNYGAGFLNVSAPGGGMSFDPETWTPIIHKTDLVLSTWSTHALPHEDQGFQIEAAPHMFLGGTSMAAAFVSGVAALARSSYGPMRPDRLRRILLKSATPLKDPASFGRGAIDAKRAVDRM